MLYEIGANGMKKIDVPENHAKNNLPIGTVLHLTGYNEPDYIIVKNLGINNKFSYYGAIYLCIEPETLIQIQKEAYTLKYISEKKDGRIQTYITDKILSTNEVLDLWERSEAKRKRMNEAQEKTKQRLDVLEAQGKELFKKYIPEDAKALIVACLDSNDSDSQTDYFAHKTAKTVILGYSKHTKDLFSEMRKHAEKIPETAHMGIGKGDFTAKVIIGQDIKSNGSYYNKGQYSHWHKDIEPENPFTTKIEAEQYIKDKGQPHSITFEGILIPFEWTIREEEIEHREKYSMGDGYYLKNGGRHSSSWRVEKCKYKMHSREIYIALAQRCIFK